MRRGGWISERWRHRDARRTRPADLHEALADEDQSLGSLGWAAMCVPVHGPAIMQTGYLRCAECEAIIEPDNFCSDLAVLTLHWMSEHPERYAAAHPEALA